MQREREKLAKKREKEKLAKEREREKLAKEREKERERFRKQRDRDKLAQERQKEKLAKERELERARARKEREREKLDREREKERKRTELKAAREQVKLERRREMERLRAERVAKREQQRKAREEERARIRAQKEEEREEQRRLKEDERARKEAEREAYRKAKEAERERLRAAKEAARRALEGRIAEATRQANKLGAGRSATTRVYHPGSIPNQSGTTRKRLDEAIRRPTMGSPPPSDTPPPATEEVYRSSPPAKPEPPARIDERYTLIEQRLREMPQEFQREYRESLDMSWIYHDSALEGVVYTFQELKTAIDPNITVVPDSSLQPVCEEIRRHKAAIELARELGDRKRAPISVDDVKRLYLTLHPEEGDLKTVKYRKDIPQHRLYFHEYAAPDKVAHRVRQIVEWLAGPEAKKLKDPIRIAARAHYDLLRVFPFPQDSGKVSRLLLNVLLLRAGYPPAIIHSTERQRYYDALRGSLPVIGNMITESITNGLQSIEKRLEEAT